MLLTADRPAAATRPAPDLDRLAHAGTRFEPIDATIPITRRVTVNGLINEYHRAA